MFIIFITVLAFSVLSTQGSWKNRSSINLVINKNIFILDKIHSMLWVLKNCY